MPYFGSRSGSRPKAKQASEIIKKLVETRPDLHFVDLQTITTNKDSLFGYAPDYFHPNNISYKNWADAFWQQIDKNN